MPGLGLGLQRALSRRSGASSGVPAFTPAALFVDASVGVWYDPSDLSSMSQNSDGTVAAAVDGPVGRIMDKSGNGLHATQASAAARPILRAGGFLEFDGTDDFLTAPWQSAGNVSRFLCAAYAPNSVTGVEPLLGFAADEIFSTWYMLQSRTSGVVGDPYFAGYQDDLTGTAQTLDAKVGLVRNVGNAFVLRKDGAQVNAGTKTITVPATDPSIGRDPRDYAAGKMYGLVGATKALSDADMAALESWMAGKLPA